MLSFFLKIIFCTNHIVWIHMNYQPIRQHVNVKNIMRFIYMNYFVQCHSYIFGRSSYAPLIIRFRGGPFFFLSKNHTFLYKSHHMSSYELATNSAKHEIVTIRNGIISQVYVCIRSALCPTDGWVHAYIWFFLQRFPYESHLTIALHLLIHFHFLMRSGCVLMF